jgi:hypothetical protein
MKRESKYYTPEIEEFHVGFEIEILSPTFKDGWREMIVEDWNDIVMLEVNYPESNIRVKHLDREDIESLGYKHFKHHPKGAFSAVDYYSGYSAGLTHYHDTNTIVIYEQLQGDMEGETWFRGKIKNKSELKRILKQIGV